MSKQKYNEELVREWCKQNGYLLIRESVYEQEITKAYFEGQNANICEDCISRQAVLDTLDTSDRFMDEDRTVDTYRALLKECYEVLPSVKPQPKMGRWIESDALLIATNEDGCMKFPAKECSVCHKPHIKAYWMDYCPNCGAKMEGEQ